MASSTISHTLPIGYILNDRYTIDSILGEGGFGITYKAVDRSLSPDSTGYVAIKEYYPSGIAARTTNKNNPYFVTHFDGKLAVSFRKGLERFRQEAFLLKEFCKLESIVSIIDIFDTNNTTYIAMEYIEGLTIHKLVKKDGPLSFQETIDLLKPVLKDMSLIHQKGLIHRDISPDNLLIGTDNKLHLIDFGSANHSNLNASKTYTVILKAGYAPPEQYIANGKMGPWTDVYGICATIYYSVTGHPPMDSLRRMQQDPLSETITLQLNAMPDLETYQAEAILKGLSLSITDRYPSVSILLNALTTPPDNDLITEIHAAATDTHITTDVSENVKAAPFAKNLAIAVAAAVFTALAGYAILSQKNTSNNSSSVQFTSQFETDSESDAIINDSAPENTESIETDYQILTMVNFSGWSIADAVSYLSKIDSNIQVHTTTEFNDDYAKGTIISQSIQKDTQFTKGNITNITLTVSNGKKPESTFQASSDNNSDSNNETASAGKSYDNTDKTTGNNTSGSNKKSSSGSNSNDDGYTVIHIGD